MLEYMFPSLRSANPGSGKWPVVRVPYSLTPFHSCLSSHCGVFFCVVTSSTCGDIPPLIGALDGECHSLPRHFFLFFVIFPLSRRAASQGHRSLFSNHIGALHHTGSMAICGSDSSVRPGTLRSSSPVIVAFNSKSVSLKVVL